jgi:hemoglobin
LAVALLAAATPAAPQYGTRTDFNAMLRKILDAWETMDVTKVAPYYSQDPTHPFFDIAPVKYTGWTEYAEGVKKLFADFSSVKFTLNPDLWVQQRGSTAWGAVTVRTEIVLKSGAKQSLDNRWTIIFEKHGRDWIIAHDHFSAPVPPPPDTSAWPLYKRLGGYDALAAVVDDFLPRLLNDPQLKRFFGGVSTNSASRIRQLVVDQLCAATGGPCVYIGRDMKTAHAGLGISSADWDRSVEHLVATLDKFHVPAREKSEVLAALSGLKPNIVEK